MAELVELDHVRHDPVEESTVVAHQHHPRALFEHPGLEPFESVEVEVVGGFVEQVHVEPAEEQRRERCTGGFATRQ